MPINESFNGDKRTVSQIEFLKSHDILSPNGHRELITRLGNALSILSDQYGPFLNPGHVLEPISFAVVDGDIIGSLATTETLASKLSRENQQMHIFCEAGVRYYTAQILTQQGWYMASRRMGNVNPSDDSIIAAYGEGIVKHGENAHRAFFGSIPRKMSTKIIRDMNGTLTALLPNYSPNALVIPKDADGIFYIKDCFAVIRNPARPRNVTAGLPVSFALLAGYERREEEKENIDLIYVRVLHEQMHSFGADTQSVLFH